MRQSRLDKTRRESKAGKTRGGGREKKCDCLRQEPKKKAAKEEKFKGTIRATNLSRITRREQDTPTSSF